MSQSGFPEGFESAKSFGPTWEPRQTGSKKEGNLVELQPGDDSWISGFYSGSKDRVGKNKSYVHEIILDKVGNEKHLVGELDESKRVQIWGSTVLDAFFLEKVQPGQLIAIKWLGKKQTKDGSNAFHDWEPFVSKDVKPMAVTDNIPDPIASITQEPSSNPVNAASQLDEDDDDLPF